MAYVVKDASQFLVLGLAIRAPPFMVSFLLYPSLVHGALYSSTPVCSIIS